jgi:hypothetical protein
MAERIVSPGVFTRENDLSFLPQGIGNIGAVFIGPTLKGPAFVPTVIQNGFTEFEQKFGSLYNGSYVPHSVREYMKNGGTATIIRVMNEGGYTYAAASNKLTAIISGSTILTVLHPSKNNNDSLLDLSETTLSPSTPSITGSFALTVSGSGVSAQTYSASLLTTQTNYLPRVLGTNSDNSLTAVNTYSNTAFPYLLFTDTIAASFSGSAVSVVDSSQDVSFPKYQAASTPWIVSQYNGGLYKNLFKLHHLSHGNSTNTDIKIGITGLREFSDSTVYSTFSVVIRRFDDTDNRQVVLETFNNLDLNPDSPNYIARVIGDRYFEYNTTNNKVETKGNYTNKSAYVRVEVDPLVESKAYAPSLSPRGFAKLKQTIIGFPTYNLPAPTYLDPSDFDTYSARNYKGYDFSTTDNNQYLKTIPNVGGVESSSLGNLFHVDLYFGHPSSSYVGSLSASLATTTNLTYDQLQFLVPLQGGADGMSPTTRILTGEYIENDNVFGFNCSTSSTSGSQAYATALNIISNSDEYDINMIVTPGILKALHPSVTSKATEICEERADAFYVMDLTEANDNVATAISEQEGLDSNYAAVWYPWVKILDANTNKPVFVPPSVVIPGVLAYTDRVAGEWWAPAGLNRGGIGSAIEAKIKLNQAERDDLYENRINPIAQFPGQGVCVWGQKTLQDGSSALDRINVRRLMIRLKKFVASSSRYLVFDPNTTVTRNRFLSIVNPYLESVQSRQGLYSFKVVMDDTNNTPDVIDRNELVGAIYLQPTKAAEFIIIDFNINPTGVTVA